MYLYVSVVIKDKSSLYAAWVRWFSPPSPPLHKTNKMFHFGTQIVREYKVQTVFNCYLCEKAVFQRPVLLTWLTLLLCPVGLREFSSHNENVRLQPHIRAEIYWVTEFMNTLKWDPHYFSPVYILVTFLFGAVSWDLSGRQSTEPSLIVLFTSQSWLLHPVANYPIHACSVGEFKGDRYANYCCQLCLTLFLFFSWWFKLNNWLFF